MFFETLWRQIFTELISTGSFERKKFLCAAFGPANKLMSTKFWHICSKFSFLTFISTRNHPNPILSVLLIFVIRKGCVQLDIFVFFVDTSKWCLYFSPQSLSPAGILSKNIYPLFCENQIGGKKFTINQLETYVKNTDIDMFYFLLKVVPK